MIVIREKPMYLKNHTIVQIRLDLSILYFYLGNFIEDLKVSEVKTRNT